MKNIDNWFSLDTNFALSVNVLKCTESQKADALLSVKVLIPSENFTKYDDVLNL